MLSVAGTVVGTTFGGAVCTAVHRWLACDDGHEQVGYVDCGITDRWTLCGTDDTGAVFVDSALAVPSASITIVVDPARRGQEIGRALFDALSEQPELAHARLFGAGVEPDNICLDALFEPARFTCRSERHDW
jgi:ribosomal protein S18 acetylase RimI-like enzyme